MRHLGLLALAFLGTSACVPLEPSVSTGNITGGDDSPLDPDAAPGTPDAHPAPDARPGTPDARPLPDAAPGTPDAHPVPDAQVLPDAHPPILETLTVSFKTTSNGGQFSPKNIVAVWIEDANGNFVKTIGRWAGTRVQHLVGWVQQSGQDADAISGATRSNHTPTLTVHWDFKDRSGQLVPDGAYNIRMELADSNSFLTSQNHEGTFPLQKNGTAANQSTSGGGFTNVAITYSGR